LLGSKPPDLGRVRRGAGQELARFADEPPRWGMNCLREVQFGVDPLAVHGHELERAVVVGDRVDAERGADVVVLGDVGECLQGQKRVRLEVRKLGAGIVVVGKQYRFRTVWRRSHCEKLDSVAVGAVGETDEDVSGNRGRCRRGRGWGRAGRCVEAGRTKK